MWNALNDFTLFGKTVSWDVETTLFWLCIAVGILIVITFITFVILIVRTRKGPEPEEEKAEEPEPVPVPAPVVVPVPVVAPIAEPIVVAEESAEAGTLRYDRSFTAKLIQSEDEIKSWYTELKNELLSYRKVRDRTSWKHESYRFGREPVARITFRGKTMCLLLPLDPAAYAESKYKVEDVSDLASATELPCMYRIKNERRVKYAKELIAEVMSRYDSVREEHESVDYYVPYEGIVELIGKGLIKRKISTSEEDAFLRARQEEAAQTAAETPAPETK